jgi:hypothetical protein
LRLDGDNGQQANCFHRGTVGKLRGKNFRTHVVPVNGWQYVVIN